MLGVLKNYIIFGIKRKYLRKTDFSATFLSDVLIELLDSFKDCELMLETMFFYRRKLSLLDKLPFAKHFEMILVFCKLK